MWLIFGGFPPAVRDNTNQCNALHNNLARIQTLLNSWFSRKLRDSWKLGEIKITPNSCSSRTFAAVTLLCNIDWDKWLAKRQVVSPFQKFAQCLNVKCPSAWQCIVPGDSPVHTAASSSADTSLHLAAIISMKRNEVSSKHHADHDELKADAWHQNSGMQQPMR